MSLPAPRRVAAGRGYAWFMDGGDLFARAWMRMLAAGAVLLLLNAMTQIPFLGPFAALLTFPVVGGILWGLERLRSDGVFPAGSPWAMLRKGAPAWRLAGLAALIIIVNIVLLLLLWSWLSLPADIAGLLQLEDPAGAAELGWDTATVLRLLLLVGLIGTVAALLYFMAIPLIVFAGAGALQAAGLGLRAVLLNTPAVLVFGLVMTVALVGVFLILSLVVMLLSAVIPTPLAEYLVALVLLVALVAVQMVLLGAQYRAYMEIFGIPDAAVEGEINPPSGDDGAMVA